MDIINKLYESVDYNNLKFDYLGSTKNVNFYEFMDSKDLFNKIRNSQIRFSDAQEKQKLFLNKFNNVKIGGKNNEQKEIINIISKNFIYPEVKFLIFLKTILKWCLILNMGKNKMKLKKKDLKY